jgi:putative glutamine amidotransferase
MTVVGITACRKLEDYRQSTIHAGADVRILEPSMSISEAVEGLDGLLLTGGEDVAPERYGQARQPTVVDVNEARDQFEVELVGEARRRGLPILAICRGIQLLNVACGGTLVQDIPSQIASTLDHTVSTPKDAVAHRVQVMPDTLLDRALARHVGGDGSCAVNSRHHQSADAVAPGFVVSAVAPDGVIEAIERPASAFCLGVQWHPENFWRTREFQPLFEAFVAACRR